MLEFLNQNPIIVFVFAVAIVFVLFFVFVKPNKKSKKSSEKKVIKKEMDSKSETGKNEDSENLSKSEPVVEEQEKKRVKKAKQKPEIVQIYKRVKVEGSEQLKEEQVDGLEDIESRGQFVKTSNKISKFVGLSDIIKNEDK